MGNYCNRKITADGHAQSNPNTFSYFNANNHPDGYSDAYCDSYKYAKPNSKQNSLNYWYNIYGREYIFPGIG